MVIYGYELAAMLLAYEPDCGLECCHMEFRLTYQGQLLGENNKHTHASHKHNIRKVFSGQLRRYWDLHPQLQNMSLQLRDEPGVNHMIVPYLERKHAFDGWRFVPLVTG